MMSIVAQVLESGVGPIALELLLKPVKYHKSMPDFPCSNMLMNLNAKSPMQRLRSPA